MSGSTTNTFLTLASARKAGRDRVARLARDALAQRDADVEIAAARGGGVDRDRLAHRDFERAPDHHLGAHRASSTAVSVRLMARPPMVAVWNSASRRRVIAVRWNTGFFFTAP